MSTSRTYATYSRPQGVDRQGRPRCLQCRKGITAPRRRTFCSDPCADKFRLRTSPSYVRQQVWKRDQGICNKCKKDTTAHYEKRYRRATGTGHLWQAHHIVAVSEGGGECVLDNYATLCTACHAKATLALTRRRAETRAKAV